MRKFNITGPCVASEDYMVDTSEKIYKIMEMINERQYFTINQARQFGKTTTISLLQKKLTGHYLCIRMSFEGIGYRMI